MDARVLFSVLLAAAPAAAELRFHAPLELSAEARIAGGDRHPLRSTGVRFERAARFPHGAELSYDARGNLYAEQGAASFWFRADEPLGRVGFPLFSVSYEQHSTWDFNFLRVDWNGTDLRARVRDRNMQDTSIRAGDAKPQTGSWTHVAVVWSEPGGLALYVNGKPAGRAPGPLALDARLDQFGFLSRAVTPHHTSGTENAGSIRDARIYAAPLDDAAVAQLAAGREPELPQRTAAGWMERFGWNDSAPRGSVFSVRRIPAVESRDLGKFWFKGVDGKRETTWPMVSHGYREEGKTYRLRSAEPANLLRFTGNLHGRELDYQPWSGGESFTIDRKSGVLGDLEFLRVAPQVQPSDGEWMRFTPANQPRFDLRRHPSTYSAWQPGVSAGAAAAGMPAGKYHYLLAPVAEETGLASVRLRLNGSPGAFYYAAVADPLDAGRALIEFDARAAGEKVELLLAFPPVVIAAGSSVTVTLASSNSFTVEAQLEKVTAQAAGPTHVAERLRQIRDSFQMLSEARPWMQIGRSKSRESLRRELKLVDELFTLLEDVRRVAPGDATANGYWSWINRYEAPPAFQDPGRSDPRVPLWAHRQLILLKQYRQVVDWWIQHRQIDSGEIGGGLGDDTDMIQNWPAVALMDGPAGQISRSVRKVLEACYAQGMVERGMNSHRTDALHAYEEGMNAYGPAFLLDYGNPVLFERMMETASHYARLTGINQAGHRHLRSNLYSATDLVEEGFHAREDIYAHLILHPGLYVAWYNRNPAVLKLLEEFGSSLVSHWKQETFPSFAKTIFFADDRVTGRSSPNTETFNLLWGLWALTGKSDFLHLQRAAVSAGAVATASATNSPWVSALGGGELQKTLMAEVERRNIHDHNLQTDQQGLVARVLAWQAGASRELIEDAQLAVMRHMTQNMYLYTEAEQFTDRIWIPTLATQRERMGGVAHMRNHIWPGHAVSWENTGGEVAALVPEATTDRLKIELFHAGERARTVTMRTWMLEHGEYEMTVSGAPPRRMALKRYSPVQLALQPKRGVTVEFRQIGKRTPAGQLPDLAIAAEEIRDNGALEVPVHNIGGAASGPFTLTVRDASGKVLGRASGASLEAPLDLKPRVSLIRVAGVRKQPGLQVTVSKTGDEICDENNSARL